MCWEQPEILLSKRFFDRETDCRTEKKAENLHLSGKRQKHVGFGYGCVVPKYEKVQNPTAQILCEHWAVTVSSFLWRARVDEGAPNVFRCWAWIIFRNFPLADQSISADLSPDHSGEHKMSSLCQQSPEHQLTTKSPQELSSDVYEMEICGERMVAGEKRAVMSSQILSKEQFPG